MGLIMSDTVLVTGGAGYIGAHACKVLARAGFTPVTFDNLNTGWEEAVKFGPFFKGDLMNRADVDAAFAQYKPVAVLHFAALSLVGESMTDPGKYWRVNVMGALNLIEGALAAGCRNFVFSSTCATYGDQDGVLLDENSVQLPINSYGASKRAIEDMLRNFGASHGLNHVIFRYFNVAGCDPDGEVGEQHTPETHLIPLMLDAVAGKRPALTVFGSDYPTRDGTCVRDYVHVLDLAQAHILAMQALDQLGSRKYNLGNGNGFSILELIETAEQVTRREVPYEFGPRRPGDPAILVASSKKIREELGWQPKYTTLEQILSTAWEWHMRHPDGYRTA
jgi:UDP-glucose 4-epimerase